MSSVFLIIARHSSSSVRCEHRTVTLDATIQKLFASHFAVSKLNTRLMACPRRWRSKSSWRHVAAEFDKPAASGNTVDISIALAWR
jgi:hypothetical protein